MLWYKTWRETRTRFVMSVLTLIAVCGIILALQQDSRAAHHMSYSQYVWSAIYKDYVRNLFLMMTAVLGGGTLLQEWEEGTAGFTLALPVSRWRLTLVRAAVGSLEVFLLALVPAVLVPLLATMTGEGYAARQSFLYLPLWCCCGWTVFGLAQLLASVIRGAAAGWLSCFLVLMLYAAAVNLTRLSQYPELNFFSVMSGMGMSYFDPVSCVIDGALPWTTLLAAVLVGCGFVAGAGSISRARDFA